MKSEKNQTPLKNPDIFNMSNDFLLLGVVGLLFTGFLKIGEKIEAKLVNIRDTMINRIK